MVWCVRLLVAFMCLLDEQNQSDAFATTHSIVARALLLFGEEDRQLGLQIAGIGDSEACCGEPDWRKEFGNGLPFPGRPVTGFVLSMHQYVLSPAEKLKVRTYKAYSHKLVYKAMASKAQPVPRHCRNLAIHKGVNLFLQFPACLPRGPDVFDAVAHNLVATPDCFHDGDVSLLW